MNIVALSGRLTKDPDVRQTNGAEPMTVASYTLAVDRRGRGRNGEQTADFIRCVALGKPGEFAEKYLQKGMKVNITGHIQTGSYTDRDGRKVFTTDIIAESHEFCESRRDRDNDGDAYEPAPRRETAKPADDDFKPVRNKDEKSVPFIPDIPDDEPGGLPFN